MFGRDLEPEMNCSSTHNLTRQSRRGAEAIESRQLLYGFPQLRIIRLLAFARFRRWWRRPQRNPPFLGERRTKFRAACLLSQDGSVKRGGSARKVIVLVQVAVKTPCQFRGLRPIDGMVALEEDDGDDAAGLRVGEGAEPAESGSSAASKFRSCRAPVRR